jgi:MFS family permease
MWTDMYLLTLSSFQILYGKLYSLFLIKLIYIVAIVIFEIGSLICTVAPNSAALICGRAIAGLGASGIFSGSVLITTKIIPLSKRAAYLGVMSAVFGIAAIAGPFVGGALTDNSTWRWCFGINLPLGVFTIVVCVFLVQTPTDPAVRTLTLRQKIQQFDIPGTVLMVAGLICLLLGLQWGGGLYSWSNGRVIALLILAGVLLITFAVLEATSRISKSQTIPNSIKDNYHIWLAVSYAMGITGSIYVAIVYLPIWFQAIRNKTALTSGILLTPMIAGYVVASVIAGGVTSATGYYNPGLIVGTILSVCGAGLLTTLVPSTSTPRLVGYEILFGLGAGFGFGQPTYIVQTLLPEVDVPIGVTFITLVQNLSASIFVAIGQSVFQNKLRQSLSSIIPKTGDSDMLQGSANTLLKMLPEGDRPRALNAYSESLINTVYISLALACVTVFGAACIRWQSMKRAKSAESEAEKEEDHKDENNPANNDQLA